MGDGSGSRTETRRSAGIHRRIGELVRDAVYNRQRISNAGSRVRSVRQQTTMVKAESTANCRRLANSEKAMLRKPRVSIAEAMTTGRPTRTLVLWTACSGLRPRRRSAR